MSVHAVIVNWNGRADTLRCLDALRRSRTPPAAVHVVDNGSTDGSVQAIEEAQPGTEVIARGENTGFAAAANAGIRNALQAGAAYVLLVNNDALLDPDALGELRAAADRHPEAGLYAPKIYADRERGILWCCGVSLGWWPNLGRLRGHGRRDTGRFDEEVFTDSLTGCVLLIARDVLERCGPLDEDFWVYVEDADLCLRARNMGFSPLYVPGAVAEHPGAGSTGGGYGAARKYLTAFGSGLLVRKHLRRRPGLLLSLLAFDLLPAPVLLLVAALRGRLAAARAKLRGLAHGLSGRAPDRGVVQRSGDR